MAQRLPLTIGSLAFEISEDVAGAERGVRGINTERMGRMVAPNGQSTLNSPPSGWAVSQIRPSSCSIFAVVHQIRVSCLHQTGPRLGLLTMIHMRWVTGLMLVGYAASALGQQPVARRRGPSIQQAIVAVRRATVTISATVSGGESQGSGVLLTPDGVIATAAHVVHGATAAKVRLPGGETYDVQGVIAMDEARDFALLRIPAFGLPTAPLGNSDSVAVGTHLLGFGAPLGFEATVSDGLLSAAP